MHEIEMRQKDFVGYEYKEMCADGSRASFLIDGYESFGWELDKNLLENGKNANQHGQNKMKLCLKRNRKIMNKMELTRLERNFEACLAEIEALEKARTSSAMVAALATGVAGTAFMAGSVFAVTAQPPHVITCILLAVPGFLGWILPCFLYKKIVEKQTKRLIPLIEEKYDEIYEICEKGNKLLI